MNRNRNPGSGAVVIRLARSPQDVLKVMVVRGIVFIEEQGVDRDGEIDGFEEGA